MCKVISFHVLVNEKSGFGAMSYRITESTLRREYNFFIILSHAWLENLSNFYTENKGNFLCAKMKLSYQNVL